MCAIALALSNSAMFLVIDSLTEYLGLDYTLALKLHLYHYAFRDVVTWAMSLGKRPIVRNLQRHELANVERRAE